MVDHVIFFMLLWWPFYNESSSRHADVTLSCLKSQPEEIKPTGGEMTQAREQSADM